MPLDAIVAPGAFYELAISENGRRTRNEARVTTEPPLNFNSRRDIATVVTVQLIDGTRRNLFEVLTNVLNMWIDEFDAMGVLPRQAHFPGISHDIPARRSAGEAAPLHLVATQGLRFREIIHFQRYSYETGTRESLDISGWNLAFDITKPSYVVEAVLRHASGAEVRRTVELTEAENREYSELSTDGQRAAFLGTLARTKASLVAEMMQEARSGLTDQATAELLDVPPAEEAT